MKAIRQVLRYLKGTNDYGITYKHNGGNKIHGYSDSSYGVNTQEEKGTTGIIFYYGESPISSSTQKPATVALSSCESEFIAANAAATQALWLKRLLSKLIQSQEEKVTIQVDNKSAMSLMKNPVFMEGANTLTRSSTSLENASKEKTYKSNSFGTIWIHGSIYFAEEWGKKLSQYPHKLGDGGTTVVDPTLYQSLAGSLQYLIFTRPDITYAVQQAEYRGVANADAETCWIQSLLRELHTPLSSATIVYYDNVSVVHLSSNPFQHQSTKHIEICIHFVRDLVATGQVIKTTSTISKRWQHLWTKLPTLSFTCKDDIPNQRYYGTHLSDYFSFIDKTLTQCPTDFNLNKFKRIIKDNSQVSQPKSQVYSWIQYAITRNVQEVDIKINTGDNETFNYDHELFFNNSCLLSMKLSFCAFNPHNGAIRWDKLKCLYIDYGKLDEDLMGKILSGSPCLETLELGYCYFRGCLSKSLFKNFLVERLSCYMRTYKRFINGDEVFWDNLDALRMKLLRCVLNPPNGWGNLNFLCIRYTILDEDSIGNILSRSPCLETLELYCCNGVRRIDVASNSVKNLVLSHYGYVGPGYIDTLEINAPYICH
nr:ribonuclease H-like domain, reverse transcriptase, RNA-dependent DNA polymerase [Tanacetum cinerariifolium]